LYSASRTCIRNSLEELKKQNYISKQRGRASIVCREAARRVENVFNLGLVLNLHEGQGESYFLSLPSFLQKIEGAQKVIRSHGANLSLLPYDHYAEHPERELLRGLPVDGFLDFDFCLSPNLAAFLAGGGKNVVSCFPQHIEHIFPHRHPQVVLDLASGVRQALAHYRSLGFTRFGYFGLGDDGLWTYNIFAKTALEVGTRLDPRSSMLHPEKTANPPLLAEILGMFADVITKAEAAPQVLFMDSSACAEQLVQILRSREAVFLQTGRICAVGGREGIEIARRVNIDLIEYRHADGGAKAAELLMKMVLREELASRREAVDSRFVEAQSEF
jgi:DNA-binding LacI/PurR family transcriptional regulator